MMKFLENVLGIIIYSVMFFLFILIGGWGLELREIISVSLILGFFSGLINNIETVLRELFDKKS